MADADKSFAYLTLTNSPGTKGTSFIVQKSDEAGLPTPPFNATVWPARAEPIYTGNANTAAEIVRVNKISGNTLSVARLQEGGQTAANVTKGYQIAPTVIKQPQPPPHIFAATLSNLSRRA